MTASQHCFWKHGSVGGNWSVVHAPDVEHAPHAVTSPKSAAQVRGDVVTEPLESAGLVGMLRLSQIFSNRERSICSRAAFVIERQ